MNILRRPKGSSNILEAYRGGLQRGEKYEEELKSIIEVYRELNKGNEKEAVIVVYPSLESTFLSVRAYARLTIAPLQGGNR